MLSLALVLLMAAGPTSVDSGACATASQPDPFQTFLSATMTITASDPARFENVAGRTTAAGKVGRTPIARGPGGTVVFRSGLAIDADGAPNAYAPHDRGIDNLGNATDLVRRNGALVRQGPGDPFPGDYVSPTSLQQSGKRESDPTRYVDSTKIPYIALPPELLGSSGAMLGDLAAVEYKGHIVFAIVADVGPHNQVGEGSVALANALGIASNPRHGGVDGGVRVVLLPGSGHGRPMSAPDIDREGRIALAAAAGSK